jgi:hypothetical protein
MRRIGVRLGPFKCAACAVLCTGFLLIFGITLTIYLSLQKSRNRGDSLPIILGGFLSVFAIIIYFRMILGEYWWVYIVSFVFACSFMWFIFKADKGKFNQPAEFNNPINTQNRNDALLHKIEGIVNQLIQRDQTDEEQYRLWGEENARREREKQAEIEKAYRLWGEENKKKEKEKQSESDEAYKQLEEKNNPNDRKLTKKGDRWYGDKSWWNEENAKRNNSNNDEQNNKNEPWYGDKNWWDEEK